MAGGAGRVCMFAVQFERKLRVVNLRRLPAIRHMTGGALSTERALVSIIVSVTGGAVLRRALEDTVNMAAGTSHGGMFAIEVEGELRMIHGRGLPSTGRMAGGAIRAQLPFMRVVHRMTGYAVLRRAFEYAIDMTLLAGNGCVLTVKMERELGMIHLGQVPAFG